MSAPDTSRPSPVRPRPVLIVTGASRGIGASVARLAGARGYDVAVNYRTDEDAAQAVCGDIETAGGRAVAIHADVARADEVERLFADASIRLGRVTHVVNNAGITGRSSRLDAADPELLREVVDLNVTGALLVARAAVRALSTRHGGAGGAIVNISSVAAGIGSPGEYVWYAATKGAVDALTLGLAREVAEEGVRVNGVAPGLVDTDIHERSTGDAARVARITPLIPMKRIGAPAEIAEAVLFLLSDAASYVTGATLRVAGGR